MKPGDTIIDNDPRMKGRTLVIECMSGPYGVYAKDKAGRTFGILTRRIYTDGKPRRSGFTLAATPASPTSAEGKP
jgi:hypothetical protein